MLEKYVRIRQDLHCHPELSGKEQRTAEQIIKHLQAVVPTAIHLSIGGNGVIAEYNFGSTGPALLFRADTDAVSIPETLAIPYCSVNTGVSHKCGHDGHTAILLAFAELLHQHPLQRGKIILLFQPSEENGKGAQAVFRNPSFRQLKIDKAFALHNLPGFPCNTIICRPGSFTCSVISCTIRIQGKTSHAAEPEKAISPVPALLKILNETESWNCNEPTSTGYFRSTLIELHIGEEAYGVTAGDGLIRLTLRASTETSLQAHIRKLEKLVKAEVNPHKAMNYSIEWVEAFVANENHPTAVETIRKAAANNHFLYQESDRPFAWGEDFGLFTQHFPGAMFGLGAGIETSALHTPDYDFPDKVIAAGAQMFYEIARLESL